MAWLRESASEYILWHGLNFKVESFFSFQKSHHLSHFCSVIVILLMCKRVKSKAKAKQTVGMRSKRKPVKPGDRGQISQIHITKRSYKSSRGGVSVVPAKINPSLTIQGHQHGTHGGQSLSNNNKQQGQNLHPSFNGR